LFTNGGQVEQAVLACIALATAVIFALGVSAIVWLDAPLKDPS
jgi:hypothetical protein